MSLGQALTSSPSITFRSMLLQQADLVRFFRQSLSSYSRSSNQLISAETPETLTLSYLQSFRQAVFWVFFPTPTRARATSFHQFVFLILTCKFLKRRTVLEKNWISFMMSFAPVGNRSRRGGWRRPSLTNASPTTTTPAPPFGELLSKVRLTDLDESAREFKDTAVIRNVVSIASFNWQRASKPTIVIPGMLFE